MTARILVAEDERAAQRDERKRAHAGKVFLSGALLLCDLALESHQRTEADRQERVQ